jgi:two-component system NarL family response regulator
LPIKVLIADDHALLREGLRKILEMESDLKVVGEACDGQDAVEKAATLHPDVILMDINMPNGGGLEATRIIRSRFPEINVIVLTIHDDDEYIVELVNAGAKGYILKDVEPARVIDAIHRVHEGEAFIPSDLMTKVFREFKRAAAYGRKSVPQPIYPSLLPEKTVNIDYLTSREQEVLQSIVDGHTNREIAKELFISEKTVKNHVTNILKKLDLSDRTQAAVYALRHGLVKTE